MNSRILAIIAAMLVDTSVDLSSEVEAIVGGYHGDAFRILGPHMVSSVKEPQRWEIRAFKPQAERVEVVTPDRVIPTERIHSDGFFVAKCECEIREYRLRVHEYGGHTYEIDDAYRFPTQVSDFDLYLFGEGTNYESYNTMGAHICESLGVRGVRFAVWAPNAEVVCLVADFNNWDTRRHPMRLRTAGVWEIFIPGIGEGHPYKFFVRSRYRGHRQMKADPFGFGMEIPPASASIVSNLDRYEWHDSEWMESRGKKDLLKEPVS